jgi:hypothetical protein
MYLQASRTSSSCPPLYTAICRIACRNARRQNPTFGSAASAQAVDQPWRAIRCTWVQRCRIYSCPSKAERSLPRFHERCPRPHKSCSVYTLPSIGRASLHVNQKQLARSFSNRTFASFDTYHVVHSDDHAWGEQRDSESVSTLKVLVSKDDVLWTCPLPQESSSECLVKASMSM